MTSLSANSLSAIDAAYHLHPNSNPRVVLSEGAMVITRGEGIRIFDENGKGYIEGLAGLWCASLGFHQPRLAAAAARQFEALPYYHSFFARVPGVTAKLAEEIIRVTPPSVSKVFFACSGSEANDSAIKMIWYYNNAVGRPEKKKVVSRMNAYHGVTIAAASMTRIPINQNGFDLPIDRFLQVSCPHHYRFAYPGESEEAFSERLAAELEALIEREGAETIAAFFAEPVMGAGGVIPPPRGYFERIQPILKKHDIFFVVDEVICGFGRTGNLFGSETYGLVPDVMTMAKGLSAGYQPISAVAISEEIFQGLAEQAEAFGMLGHGFTYGGHPIAAAVALEALRIYEDEHIIDHVKTVMPRFQQRLKILANHPLVGEARGVGLIGALEVVADKSSKREFPPSDGIGAKIAEASKQRGLLFRNKGDTLLLCPPLIILEEEIDVLFDILTVALDEVLSKLPLGHASA